MNLKKPIFEDKTHGPGGGIPLLKSLWDKFEISLLFLQNGFQKHSGVSAWMMAFTYLCGLIAQTTSINQNAKFSKDSPILGFLMNGQNITQSAFSRFFSKPYEWFKLSVARVRKLQDHTETRFSDGDIIALDDTKIAHPFGKKLPFLCWLFDSSKSSHVWCMNLLSTLAVLKNSFEYPMFWRIWVKDKTSAKKSKLELAKQMLLELRSFCNVRLWIVMDRWFLCKDFFDWLESHNFDWITKAKKNTVLYRKEGTHFIKVNPLMILSRCYGQLCQFGKGSVIIVPDIYIKRSYESTNKKGKPMRKWRFVPIAAVASTYHKDTAEGLIESEDETVTFRDAFLLISNRNDLPDEIAGIYCKRWRIEVFYRNAKQELGLTNCHSQSENAHFAHIELLFLAETLLCYAKWECNKEGADKAPSHREMVRYLFNASHRICCDEQIQVYYDITSAKFSRFIAKFWPQNLSFFLWNFLPSNA